MSRIPKVGSHVDSDVDVDVVGTLVGAGRRCREDRNALVITFSSLFVIGIMLRATKFLIAPKTLFGKKPSKHFESTDAVSRHTVLPEYGDPVTLPDYGGAPFTTGTLRSTLCTAINVIIP